MLEFGSKHIVALLAGIFIEAGDESRAFVERLLGSVSGAERLKWWFQSAATGKLLREVGPFTSQTVAVAFSPDGKYLAAGSAGVSGERRWAIKQLQSARLVAAVAELGS